MTDFVDPEVIAAINGAKDELIDEVAKAKPCVEMICEYAGSLPNPIIPEAPIDGKVYGRKDGDWAEVSSGGGVEAKWGDITGELSSQTDLQEALDLKTNDSELATVAKSGKYDDLVGKPSLVGEAPQDNKQYARINAGWQRVAADLPQDPVLYGTTIMSPPDSNFPEDDGVVFSTSDLGNFDSQFDMWKRAFSNTFSWRVRVNDKGIFYAKDENGVDFSRVVLESDDNNAVEEINPVMRGKMTLNRNATEIDRLEVRQYGTSEEIETEFNVFSEEGFGETINPYKLKITQDGLAHKKGDEEYKEIAFKTDIPTSGFRLQIIHFDDVNVQEDSGNIYGGDYVLGFSFKDFANKRVIFAQNYAPAFDPSWKLKISGEALKDEGWAEGDECILHFPQSAIQETDADDGLIVTQVYYSAFDPSPSKYSPSYFVSSRKSWVEESLSFKVTYAGDGRVIVETLSNIKQ